MNILVIGSGGREHALAWKLAMSNRVKTVFVAPGSCGIALEPKIKNVVLNSDEALINFAKQNNIDITVVGPELPLSNGIVDKFRAQGLFIWGPTQFCAQLESSKAFAKNFMQKYNIPTAKYKTFEDENSAKNYILSQQIPIVIKADGLASGKGVLVANSLDEALGFVHDIFSGNKFGEAGNKIVIEEFLDGVEASFIVMVDGNHILSLATSQDHKRLLDNDQGPNTGGMGVCSPAPIINKELHLKIIKDIINPVIDGMKKEGHTYTGFLYAGLMVDKQGNPKTLEFNCRLGDPEAQPILFRLKTDLVDLIEAGIAQKLDKVKAIWEEKFAIGVVLASSGYPSNARNNDIIKGLDKTPPDIKIFHSGTVFQNNQFYTSQGRVLCVVGMDTTMAQTQNKVYKAIQSINFDGMQYRKDIGNKLL